MAQAVYSVNVVGYIKVQIPAGFSLIANQLNNGNNTLNEVIPQADLGTTVYKFDSASGFVSSVFFGTWEPNLTLAPGEGVFVNAATATEWNLIGEVPQGENLTINVPKGFSIRSSMVPESKKLEDMNFPAELGDTVYFFRNGAYESSVFFGTWQPDAVPKVGEAFWVNKGTAADWKRNFKVQ